MYASIHFHTADLHFFNRNFNYLSILARTLRYSASQTRPRQSAKKSQLAIKPRTPEITEFHYHPHPFCWNKYGRSIIFLLIPGHRERVKVGLLIILWSALCPISYSHPRTSTDSVRPSKPVRFFGKHSHDFGLAVSHHPLRPAPP